MFLCLHASYNSNDSSNILLIHWWPNTIYILSLTLAIQQHRHHYPYIIDEKMRCRWVKCLSSSYTGINGRPVLKPRCIWLWSPFSSPNRKLEELEATAEIACSFKLANKSAFFMLTLQDPIQNRLQWDLAAHPAA